MAQIQVQILSKKYSHTFVAVSHRFLFKLLPHLTTAVINLEAFSTKQQATVTYDKCEKKKACILFVSIAFTHCVCYVLAEIIHFCHFFMQEKLQ